jgi:hypothetical protein
MTLHILVEGPSERAFFDRWLLRFLPNRDVWVHPHQGKGSLPADLNGRPDNKRRGLLDQLPATLRGLAGSPEVDGVLVMLDADSDDPLTLKANIVAVAQSCAPALRVGVSVAVEETEAFYLGDLRALQRAYPHADHQAARAYVPDSICGTWELFGQIIGDDGGNKVAWAEAMGPCVTAVLGQSRSPSFQRMAREINSLATAPTAPQRKRQYRHRSKTEKRSKGRR